MSRLCYARIHRCRPSVRTPQDGKTPLQLAAHHGKLKIINSLLAAGANINAKDDRVPASLPLLTTRQRAEPATATASSL
jgi:hypothetical protein